jgi:hypothetical protein
MGKPSVIALALSYQPNHEKKGAEIPTEHHQKGTYTSVDQRCARLDLHPHLKARENQR